MTNERRLATQLVADLRTEIVRADTKASILIAAMGLSLGAPLGAGNAAEHCESGTVWTLACASWLAALTSLLMVLAPRYRRNSWTAAVRRTALDGQPILLATAEELSHIVLVKYRWTRASLVCFAVYATTTAIYCVR